MTESEFTNQGAEIIPFKEIGMRMAIRRWYRGNRERNKKEIEKSSKELCDYAYVYPLARYFGGMAKIQLRDGDLGRNLKCVFSSMAEILSQPNAKDIEIITACRAMLKNLAEIEEEFIISEPICEGISIKEILLILEEINACGANPDLLSRLYSYLNGFLGAL